MGESVCAGHGTIGHGNGTDNENDNENDDKDRDENDDDPEPDHLQLDTRDSAVQLGEWEGRRLGTAGLS